MKILKGSAARCCLAASFIVIAGCSATLTGSGGADPLSANPFPDITPIAGPTIEGKWDSDCVPYFGGSRQLSLTYQGGNFIRAQQAFTDTACTKSPSATVLQGKFIFSKVNADGSYEINYAIDLGGGVSQLTEEKLKLIGTNIYVSDFQIGDSASVDMTMPCHQSNVTPPTPAPAPTPTPTPSGSCTNYVGQYQMNSDDFQFSQNNCSTLTMTDLTGSWSPLTFIADGVARSYGGTIETASFKNGLFNLEYQDSQSGADVVEVWSYQLRPCSLYNPDGQNYLTRDVWINGAQSPDNCAYWSRVSKGAKK